MPSSNRSRIGAGLLMVAGLGVSTVALGLPWDTDMADGQQRKAYSLEMHPLPQGAVAQPAATSPMPFAPNFVRRTPEAEALVNPLPIDDQTVARGKQMFGTYCTPCHGDGVTLGPVAGPGRFAGVAVLGGPAGVLPGMSDGHVYLTVRNGGDRMPSYGWAMSNDEIWSVVAYARTLDNGARKTAPGVIP